MTSTAKSNLVNENEDAPEYADEGEEEGDDRHVEGGADQPPWHRQASRASVCFMVMQYGFRGYIVYWETHTSRVILIEQSLTFLILHGAKLWPLTH